MRQCDIYPGEQLISVVRKGSRARQQLPASADAFVWHRLYQQELLRLGVPQPALPVPAAVPAGYGPCAESPASDLLWRLAAGDCLTGVQLGLMGVQLGGKVIWAGLRGCGCGAGTAGRQREAVTVLP
jgi:hypothetical protein